MLFCFGLACKSIVRSERTHKKVWAETLTEPANVAEQNENVLVLKCTDDTGNLPPQTKKYFVDHKSDVREREKEEERAEQRWRKRDQANERMLSSKSYEIGCFVSQVQSLCLEITEQQRKNNLVHTDFLANTILDVSIK